MTVFVYLLSKVLLSPVVANENTIYRYKGFLWYESYISKLVYIKYFYETLSRFTEIQGKIRKN